MRELIDLANPAWPSTPLPVGPGHHLSLATASLSLPKLFCVCFYFHPFLPLMGSLASVVDLGLGLLMDPATSPRFCPPCSAL